MSKQKPLSPKQIEQLRLLLTRASLQELTLICAQEFDGRVQALNLGTSWTTGQAPLSIMATTLYGLNARLRQIQEKATGKKESAE